LVGEVFFAHDGVVMDSTWRMVILDITHMIAAQLVVGTGLG